MEMFDQVTVTTTGPDGKPDSDFKKACVEFREAHKRFEKWDTHPERYENKWIRMEWWKALRILSDAEQRVYRMFVGTDEPTLKDNAQYNQFRQFYLEGKSMTPNA